MSDAPTRSVLLDAMSWKGEDEAIPWQRIDEGLLQSLDGVEVSILLTPEQLKELPEELDVEHLRFVVCEEESQREGLLEEFREKRALVVSSQASRPYSHWLPARLAPDSPMGLRFALSDGIKRFMDNGVVKPLPVVEHPLEGWLDAHKEGAEVRPPFADILALMPLPTSPFELHERIFTLCDEKMVVYLDRYLQAKIQDLVLFAGRDEEEIQAAIEQRRLTQRIRHHWAKELQIEATTSRKERLQIKHDEVQKILGFPLKQGDKRGVEEQLHKLPLAAGEHTTLAYQIDGEIHIINPDPEQEAELRSFPEVRLYKREDHMPPLQQMLEQLGQWTLDHYRADPQLDGLLSEFGHRPMDPMLLKYARAYIGYVGFPKPKRVPPPMADWRPALERLLQEPLPPVTLRYRYPHKASTVRREGSVIIEGSPKSEKSLYSPMNCIATPVSSVTLHRGRHYIQVKLSSALLGYQKGDVFSPGDEYDGVPTEQLMLQGHPPPRSSTPSEGQPATPEQLYVEYPFRHAGIGQEYLVFPLLQEEETNSELLSHPEEFLKFYQVNQSLKKLSELLAQSDDGKIPTVLAEEVMPRIEEIFQPLKREHIYFTFREGSPFPLKANWKTLDRQVGVIWLALQQALRHGPALQLHDHRVLLPVASGLYAEIAVRKLAAGVSLPFEVSLRANNEDLRRASESQASRRRAELTGLNQLHPTFLSSFGNHQFATHIQLPLPLQIVGAGLCAEVRFFHNPLLQTHPQVDISAALLQAASVPQEIPSEEQRPNASEVTTEHA